MRKKTIFVLLVLALTILLAVFYGRSVQNAQPAEAGEEASSASTEKEETFSAGDYVEVAAYDSIEAETAPVKEVDQADIQTEIDRFLAENEQLREVLDRTAVQKGDTVNIDYEVVLDGSDLPDKKTEDLNIEIGQGTMPESFEEGLVGKEKGSTAEISVTLPEDFEDRDLAGKEAVYKVSINSIFNYQIPELTDEFLKETGKKDDDGNIIDTVEKLNAYFRKQLEKKAQAEHDEALNGVILNYLMENSTFSREIPGEFTDRITAAYRKMYQEYASLYNEDLATFMARIGSTKESYEDDIRRIAEQYSRQVLILQAIGEKEGLLPGEEEKQAYAEETAVSFGYESAKAYEKDFPIELVYDNLICDKVLTYLRGNVKPVSEKSAPEGEAPSGT